jgi:serine/threonine-protein kinase
MATLEEWDDAQIVAQRLNSTERMLIARGTDGRYVPTGHVLFARRGAMFAIPFDVQRLEPRGASAPVLEGVLRTMGAVTAVSFTGSTHFAVSDSGTIAYVAGPASGTLDQSRLVLVDRSGKSQALQVPVGAHESPRVSSDGKQLAFVTTGNRQAYVSIYDIAGVSAPRRLTLEGSNRLPVWATTSHVAFQSDRGGDLAIWWQRADGTTPAERLTTPDSGVEHVPGPWFPDGRGFFFIERKSGTNRLLTLSLGERKAAPFGAVESKLALRAVLSPNGRWVAYTISGGETEGIFLQPFPATGAVYPVVSPGRFPHWGPTGRDILYSAQGQAWAATLSTERSVTFGTPMPLPREISALLAPGFDYDVMPDGRLIAITSVGEDASQRQIQIVQNWFEELRARVPAN